MLGERSGEDRIKMFIDDQIRRCFGEWLDRTAGDDN